MELGEPAKLKKNGDIAINKKMEEGDTRSELEVARASKPLLALQAG